MFRGVYSMAGKTVEICSHYPDVQQKCEVYRCSATPEVRVQVSRDDIVREREQAVADLGADAVGSEGYYEAYAVVRQLVEELFQYDILLFHASAVAVDGEGYLFTARSGTGKSTHARYWREYFGARAVMVNDDKPFLRVADGSVIVYGSPWCGKHKLHTNVAVPVKAICLLERSEENHIEPITAREAFPLLYRQTYQLKKRDSRARELALIDEMARSVRLYRLGANMSTEAARVAWEGMNGGSL